MGRCFWTCWRRAAAVEDCEDVVLGAVDMLCKWRGMARSREGEGVRKAERGEVGEGTADLALLAEQRLP